MMGRLIGLWNRVVPKRQMSFFLILIAATAVIFTRQTSAIVTILLAITTTYVADSILIRVRHIEPFPLTASIVSGLIIGLLLSPALPIYYIVLAAVFGIVSKNFLRFEGRHIFNPAGFGIAAVSLLFHIDISWWAVSFQVLKPNIVSIFLVLVLFLPGIVSFLKMRRFRIILSFWFVYLLLLFLMKIQIIFDPTVVFFSLVMLPEPMTTPNYAGRQILFGVFVALFSLIFGSLITALLLGNLVFFSLNFLLARFKMN